MKGWILVAAVVIVVVVLWRRRATAAVTVGGKVDTSPTSAKPGPGAAKRPPAVKLPPVPGNPSNSGARPLPLAPWPGTPFDLAPCRPPLVC